MKLVCEPDSFDARRIVVTAIEAGLDDRLKIVERTPGGEPPEPETSRFVRSSPALIRDDGSRLVGADAICAYLDTQHERPKLLPRKGEARLDIDQLIACSDELRIAGLARQREPNRSAPDAPGGQAGATGHSVSQVLDTLESLTDTVLVGPVTLGHIAVACALSWLDIHLPSDDWRAGRPALARWYARFSDRPSMRATESAAQTMAGTRNAG